MGNSEEDPDAISLIVGEPPFGELFEELRAGLSTYWDIADGILREGGVEVKAPTEDDVSFSRNFFSILFLYSFHRAGIPKRRRILYAATLQCLRGMVTGCDNLLDDEYKKTLDSDIPDTAFRFRSVIDIMVSDRVLFELLFEASGRGEIGPDKVLPAVVASMKTMTRSGRQEASEETGITEILSPEDLLQNVHHYKTGLLFTCPWDIPLAVGDAVESEISPLTEGLYEIGMGCQVLDDIVDFASDLERKRHNYLVSHIHCSPRPGDRRRLGELIAAAGRQHPAVEIARDFPESVSTASATARRFLESGLTRLFSASHRVFVTPSIRFLEKRIGISRMSG